MDLERRDCSSVLLLVAPFSIYSVGQLAGRHPALLFLKKANQLVMQRRPFHSTSVERRPRIATEPRAIDSQLVSAAQPVEWRS
jgi:hypothetical protein